MKDVELTVAVIIVNYRTADLVIDCLNCLEPQIRAYPGSTVFVVDEFSQDGSLAMLSTAIQTMSWSGWVQLIEAPENRGFSNGNNTVLRKILSGSIRPDYVWFLNPDTRPLEHALSALAGFLGERPEAGIVGSSLVGADGQRQAAAFRFPSLISEFERGLRIGFVSNLLSGWTVGIPLPSVPQRVDWVAGTSFMMRLKCVFDVGLLDESYFLYYEEVDLMLRARRLGVEVWTVPGSQIVHIGGQSTGVVDGKSRDGRRPLYLHQARAFYFRKNSGLFYLFLANAAWTAGAALNLLRRLTTRRDTIHERQELKDFLSFWCKSTTHAPVATDDQNDK